MTIMIGQPLAHSLNSEAGFAAFAFSSSNVNTVKAHCCAPAVLPREFLLGGTRIDEAEVRKTEQDSEASDQERAALSACCGRDLTGDA
ncbi:MAG TPA: hypothetical protein VG758_11675 [Hyphomicrobiaceae bacterium]|jgi:hypothetical protein|nr:hypothetical protein [Hyphomicrobiaceae bacterium]